MGFGRRGSEEETAFGPVGSGGLMLCVEYG